MNKIINGFSLQDLILIIGMQSRSGELLFESDNNIGTMLFYKGNILHASSPYSRAIGDLLVEAGAITDNDLIEILMLQKKKHSAPLGSMLIKSRNISCETIEKMVCEQIKQAVAEFQRWKNLSFSFADRDIKPFDSIHLPILAFIRSETINAAVHFLTNNVHFQNYTPSQTDTFPIQ